MHPGEPDLSAFEACFARNGSPRDPAAFRWQYTRAPAGAPVVDFSVDRAAEEERVAGIYAVFPVRAKVGGRTVVGAQSLDTLTDAAFRGRGIFTTLARSVYARCAAGGVGFVYGFPNGSSAPGFFSKLEWRALDPVPFLIRPLRTGYFLARFPRAGRALARLADLPLPRPRALRPGPGEEVVAVAAFGDEFDALWARASAALPVAVVRDAAYLRWRFAKPGEGYRTLAVRTAGGVSAFVTWCVKEKHGGRIGYLMELLAVPGAERAASLLLREAVRRMARERADAVLAWSLAHSPLHAAYRGAGFLVMPERMRPIELHFGVRPLDPELAPLLERRENWYLSYCDSDTV